jgi:hypothetical protein
MFKSCHILLIEAPKIRQIMKLTPRVPDKTDFVPPVTSSKVFAKAIRIKEMILYLWLVIKEGN